MKRILSSLRGGFEGFVERSHQKDYVEAVMAGAALVAMADRDQRLSELVTRDRVLARLAELQPVNVRDAVEMYDSHANALAEDFDSARRSIVALLSRFEGRREELVTLVKACMAIGHADSDFSPKERSAVELICSTVGVDPQELGVYDI
jgi:tellurite resistance protein